MHKTQQMLHKTLSSVQIVNAGTHEAALGAHLPPHQHVTWEFVYYRTGEPECRLGDAVFACEPGMLLTTPPHTVHSEFAWTAYATYWITIAAPETMPWPRMCMDNVDRTIGHMCTSIVREARRHGPSSDRMLALLAEQLDLLLDRVQEQHGLVPSERLVRAAEQMIEERFATSLMIKDIAEEVGVSCSYLRIQFVQLRGYPPMAYLQTVRVHRSIVLLRNSTLSLETIAGMCGYDSASHLSRMVKRATGSSPGTVRRKGPA